MDTGKSRVASERPEEETGIVTIAEATHLSATALWIVGGLVTAIMALSSVVAVLARYYKDARDARDKLADSVQSEAIPGIVRAEELMTQVTSLLRARKDHPGEVAEQVARRLLDEIESTLLEAVEQYHRETVKRIRRIEEALKNVQGD